MNKCLQFFEYERVAYRGKWRRDDFLKKHFEAFEHYYTKNPDTPFFELIPYGIRFKQYVGAIQIGKTTIEVLPKVGKDGSKKQWQAILLEMLKTCSLLTARQTGEAQLKLKSNSIMELYFELYLNEIEQLIRRGLIKQYQRREGQQRALKGPLKFNKHIEKNSIHKERFYIDYTVYTKSHLLHQILNEAILIVDQMSNSSLLRDKIERIKIQFPKVERCKINESHYRKLPNSRKTQVYKRALSIAELILLNYRPDIRTGKRDLLAIMFDMNKLWEEYVFRILKRNHSDVFHIKGQERKVFWGKSQRIKPDIVLKHKETDDVFVIDTKWKVINNSRPGDNDLKQMYVYNHYWESFHSLLLYPMSNEQKDISGHFTLPMQDSRHKCQLGFAKVLENGRLNGSLSHEIIAKFEQF